MTPRFTRPLVAVGVAVALSGCGTLYKLDVNAYKSADEDIGKTYVILSSNPEFDVGSEQFEVYADQLETALALHGYQRMSGDDLSSVDLGVYLSAELGEQGKRYHTVRTEIFEPVTIEYTPSGSTGGGTAGGGGGQSGSSSQGTTRGIPTTPRAESLHAVEESKFATTVYAKHLNIVAVDLQAYLTDVEEHGRSKAVPRELWSVDVETTGSPSDLNDVVPVMIAAAEPYVAKNTTETVRVSLDETSSKVKRIKAGAKD